MLPFYSHVKKVSFIIGTTTELPDIRLVDVVQSTWLYSGRVEVRQANSSWGTISKDGFDDREASIICKMLGYQFGIARSQDYLGRGTGLMYDVSCIGNETSIFDCPHWGWSPHNHGEDSGVECSYERGKCLSF